jgi:CDP-diacylglycerol--serine O-phosphatidyltransferase
MQTTRQLFPPRSWVPCLVTAANISCGFIAMLAVVNNKLNLAVYLLTLSIALDMLDGRTARLLKATSELGQQLDSFCDAVSFGIAPALLIHAAFLKQMGPVGLAITMVYIFAGLFRLVRFNLSSDVHAKASHTLGLPIPIAAAYVMATVLMRDHIPPIAVAVLVLLMAAGMASRWRLPEFNGASIVVLLMCVGMINYLVYIARPNWYTLIWWGAWNFVIVLAARIEDRRLMADATAQN